MSFVTSDYKDYLSVTYSEDDEDDGSQTDNHLIYASASDNEDDVSQAVSQVIDETDNNTQDDEGTQSLLRHKHRDSDFIGVRKKSPIALISSDSDDDDSSSSYVTPSYTGSGKEGSSRRQSVVAPSPDSAKISFEEDDHVYHEQSTKKLSSLSLLEIPSTKRGSNHRMSKSGSESPKNDLARKVGNCEIDDSSGEEDERSPSALLKNSRLSSQFQPGQGFFNSTTIAANMNVKLNQIEGGSHSGSIEVIESDMSVVEVSDSDVSEDAPTEPAQNLKEKLQDVLKANQQRTLMSFGISRTPVMAKPPLRPNTDGNAVRLADHEGFKRPEPVNLQAQFKPPTPEVNRQANSDRIEVCPSELEAQRDKVKSLTNDVTRMAMTLKTVKLETLSDKGYLLKQKHASIQAILDKEREKLSKMVVTKRDPEKPQRPAMAAWEDIKTGAETVMPKTFGKTAMSTYNAQKALTLDKLQQLHEAIRSAPKETDFMEDPKGIKVPLMPHQKRALAWLIFREKEKPSGGILADDMGLGKTLTMISLIVKSLSIEKNDENDENEFQGKNTRYNGGTLVICPASLINQWSGEIDRRLKRGLISYDVFHGTKRETKAKKLADYDVVITTYATANVECNKNGIISRIKWRRIILDEAHQIRNHKSQTNEACCSLSAKSRWALTGTPLHNKELDMYALLKFLRCSPFDDLTVWKKWVSSAQDRIHTVISSLMLRRTKVELMENGTLMCMPAKEWILVKVSLDPEEMGVYHKVLIFSRTLFTQYLHQRAEKNQDAVDQKHTDLPNNDPNGEYFKMRQKLLKLNKVKSVSSHEILVLLTRLRQICCHCSLITKMLDDTPQDLGSDDEECEELNLLDQLKKLNIDDEDEFHASQTAEGIASDEKVSLKEASKGLLNPSHPVFRSDRRSSKIKVILKVLKEKVLNTESKDKAILVSQWPSYLRLVAVHLTKEGIVHEQLDGAVPVPKRMEMVDRFNDPKDKVRVLLLSLTAGGVGLNLVGANHLFLLDLHWNPQLENQAQDRIYRVGQEKPVFVYKFLATETIEERIKALQDKKLAMAEGMLTGTKQIMSSSNKLTIDDLKMIFGLTAPPPF